jgi:hypothetical protein
MFYGAGKEVHRKRALACVAGRLLSALRLLSKHIQHCVKGTREHPHSCNTNPFWICPQPISRQCFSTRLLRAIFSPSLVHTGEVSCSLARSPFTCTIWEARTGQQ